MATDVMEEWRRMYVTLQEYAPDKSEGGCRSRTRDPCLLRWGEVVARTTRRLRRSLYTDDSTGKYSKLHFVLQITELLKMVDFIDTRL